MGRPTCGIPRCTIPLASNRHCFCPEHASQNEVCTIVDCQQLILPGKRTCNNYVHQGIERVHTQCQEAQFQLKEQLKRVAMAHPKNGETQSDLPLGEVMEKEVGETEETYYEVVGNHILHAEEDATSHTAQALASLETAETAQIPGNNSKKIRASTVWAYSPHTEQILVAPCGIIIARETFYFAEAIPSVVVSESLF